MKDKRVLLIGGAIAIFFTIVLVVVVFSIQHVIAQQPVDVEEQIPEVSATTDLPEAETEQTAIPETSQEEVIEEDELPEEAVIEQEEPTQETAITEFPEKDKLPLGSPTQPQKDLKAEEVVFSNWQEAKPSAADITGEQAVENAVIVAQKIFGIKDTKVKEAVFFKDYSGQRGSYWAVYFKEDDLCLTIDSLSGNVTNGNSDQRYENLPTVECTGPAYGVLINDIWAQTEGANSKYMPKARALGEIYLNGRLKRTELNAVHGDEKHYPLVSIFIEMEDGTSYDSEWGVDADTEEIVLCRLTAYPSWEHCCSGNTWNADYLQYKADVESFEE